jgi:flagellar basal body rod protein FlgG
MPGSGDFGLTSVESGLTTAQNALAVVANNLANQSTPGFEAAWAEPVTGPVSTGPSTASTTGQVSSVTGSVLAGSLVDLTPGSLTVTGNPSDWALTVPGYFPVRTAAGIQLTRDGQFTQDAQGQLVSPGGGVLLNLSLKPVVLPSGRYSIQNGSVVAQNGAVVAQLGVASVPNPEGLVNTGGSLLAPTAASGPVTLRPALGQDVVQGQLEASNVSLVGSMAALVALSGQYAQLTTAGRAAQQMEQVTNSLAVVS